MGASSAVEDPFAELTTAALVDSLEHDFDQGRALDPTVVWEVARRALRAGASKPCL